ncbi:MAG: hypothetical protein JNK37_05235 [Verrucomicrobiales bacterium]|nr:hypothetical protein [Verrucomicrobiales bacterium]
MAYFPGGWSHFRVTLDDLKSQCPDTPATASCQIALGVRPPQPGRRVQRANLEKYFEAGLSGWRISRLEPDRIQFTLVERLAALLNRLPSKDSTEFRG